MDRFDSKRFTRAMAANDLRGIFKRSDAAARNHPDHIARSKLAGGERAFRFNRGDDHPASPHFLRQTVANPSQSGNDEQRGEETNAALMQVGRDNVNHDEEKERT